MPLLLRAPGGAKAVVRMSQQWVLCHEWFVPADRHLPSHACNAGAPARVVALQASVAVHISQEALTLNARTYLSALKVEFGSDIGAAPKACRVDTHNCLHDGGCRA
jgi:hypothetical protein